MQPIDGHEGRVQVSAAGGTEPRWARSGRELFLLTPSGNLASAEIRQGTKGIEFGAPRPLFDVTVSGTNQPAYDVSADGQKFFISSGGMRVSRLMVMTNMLPEAP